MEEVVGVLSGSLEADEEGDGGVPLGEEFKPLSEERVAVGGFRELEFGHGRLEVVVEEGGVVSIA